MTSPPRFSQQFWSEDSRQSEPGPSNTHTESHASSEDLSTSPEVILSSDSPARQGTCAVASRVGRPRGVFVPENYEANYPYPLIIWLHENGRSERDIAEVLPRISTRNYVGLALRGMPRENGPGENNTGTDGFGWPAIERERLKFHDDLHASVREVRRDFHIHSERVFLVGAGEGATMAWEIFLARPEWFAGLAVLGGRFPWYRRPLRRFRALRRKQLLLAPDSRGDADQSERIARLMHAAGLELTLGSPSNGRRLARSVLGRIDYWIMQSIGGCL
jgi:phospholipase/carboxylesterase